VVGEAGGVPLHRFGHPVHRLQHLVEIGGGHHHVGEPPLDLGAQRVAPVGGEALHLAVHQRLGRGALAADLLHLSARAAPDPQHRVDEVLDGDLLRGQELADGVHDEGAVHDVGADHGHGSAPPLLLGVQHLHVYLVRAGALHEAERALGERRQVGGGALLEQGAGDLGEEDPGKGAQQGGVARAGALQVAAELVHREGGGRFGACRDAHSK
jgi:hypothetical protein